MICIIMITHNGGRPNIPVKTMVKVLFLQSKFNMVEEQVEVIIKNKIYKSNVTSNEWMSLKSKIGSRSIP